MEASISECLRPIDVPQCSTGAPLPHVFADEGTLFVTYLVNKPDSRFDGTKPRSTTPTTADVDTAILKVDGYQAFQFGPPNDEAIFSHRLHKLGLAPYSAFEVLNSSWVGELEKANLSHDSFSDSVRHFIFTFHDSTLEFVAHGFSIGVCSGAVLSTLIDVASGKNLPEWTVAV